MCVGRVCSRAAAATAAAAAAAAALGEESSALFMFCARRTEGIRTADGRSPFELKAGELKKAASKFGVSPMGEQTRRTCVL